MKIRVVMVPCDRPAYVTNIENSLENMQKVVGGYIETLTLQNGLIVVCNEDGQTLGLRPNDNLPEFCGDIFITCASGDEFTDLAPAVATDVLRKIRKKF